MRQKFSLAWLILLCVSLTACSSEEDLIDPKTNMPIFFCPMLRDTIEKANEDVWTLGKRTSVAQMTESMLEVAEQSQTIAIMAGPPARDWLEQLSENAGDFIYYFSGPGEDGSSQLLDIASRWKGTYEQLDDFCK